MKNVSLKTIAEDMFTRQPNSELEYYQLTLVANKEGKPNWSANGHFVGFEDDERKVELREASIILADKIVAEYRNDLKEGCFVVDTLTEIRVFLLLGGHAVIEKNIAREKLFDIVKKQPVAKAGYMGFMSTHVMEKTVFQRATTKKQRMRVIKRDSYRCKICGRSPHNNVDISLHVHHIRPWADNGLTHDDNLITLCHTCHEGLDPHFQTTFIWIFNRVRKAIKHSRIKEKTL